MLARALAVAVAVLLSTGVASAAVRDRVVERGIVQSVATGELVLRGLDGSDVPVALGPTTRIRLNGSPASSSDIRPGQVVEAVVVGGGPARVIRAFGRSVRGSEHGVIATVSTGLIEIRRSSGGVVTIELTPRTRVRIGPLVVRLRALRSGLRVEVIRAADGSAKTVVVRGRA